MTRPPTAEQFVLAEVRDAITSGRLKPGYPIRQDALAAQLGVSRVPLREALKTLVGEGLVGYQAHRGYFVETLSLADLREAYRIRELLETEAVQRASARLVAADLSRLDEIQAEVERAAAAADVLAMAAANRRFHMELYELSGMPRLVRMIRSVWDATDAYRSVYYAEAANRTRAIAEHRRTLRLLRRHDVVAAVRVLDTHRSHAVRALEKTLPES